jgi:hypothetical protein
VQATVAEGLTVPFTATGIFSDRTKEDLTSQVTWSSLQPSVASVSNALDTAGVATGLSPGSAQIQATLNGILGSANLTVTNAVLVSIEVDPVQATVAKGLTVPFTAIGHFSDETTEDLTSQVTWTSLQPSVASVSNASGTEGVATGLNPGVAQIQATLNGILGSADLTVTEAVLVSIQVNPEQATVAKGLTVPFTAIGLFSDGTTEDLTSQATWTSLQPSVASVSNASGTEGVATGLNPGVAQIQATLNGISGSANLTVTAAILTSITITPVNPVIATQSSVQFTATGVFSDNTTENLTTQVSWSSSNTSVASISNASGSKGLATGLNEGVTTIKATLNGISGSTNLTVIFCSSFSITSSSTLPVAIGGTYYDYQLTSNSTNPPVAYTIISGSLPNGFDMTTSGLIYAYVPLDYTDTAVFTVEAKSSCGATATKTFTLNVFPPL